MHRFFVPWHDLASDEVILSADESHHGAHVLRADVGSEITLFDGHGNEARAKFEARPIFVSNMPPHHTGTLLA